MSCFIVSSMTPLKKFNRFLGTLAEIATEKNSTIIFPLPLELLKAFTYDRSQEKK